MAIDTYAKLQSEVLDTLNRTDLVADVTSYTPGTIEGAVKRAIRRGELRMQREVLFRELQDSSSYSLSASSASYALPSEYGNLLFAYISGDPLTILEPKPIRKLYEDSPGAAVQKPDSIAIFGANFIVRPSPDTSYTLPFFFQKKITALSDSATSNTILTNYPDIYLYAALIEAVAHLQEDERIVVWKGFYDEAKRVINEEMTAAWTGSVLRANVSLNLVV